jgi:transposase
MSTRTLDDNQWNKVYSCLKTIPNIYIGAEADCRRFIEAVYWIARTGAPWRDLPPHLGKWNSVFKRFARWAEGGVWQTLHANCINEPDMEWLILDSTVVRAHPCAAGAPKKNGT